MTKTGSDSPSAVGENSVCAREVAGGGSQHSSGMTVVLDGSSEMDVAHAATALRHGEVVAFPTETVYGLGADATNDAAVERVFRAKGRPADNPLIVHVASVEALNEAGFAEPLSEPATRVAEKFWPGPITLVVRLRKCANISGLVTAGLDTVAVRVPKHPVASALLAAIGLPIAAPSANSSGKPSPTTAEHVLTDLSGKLDCVLDGGPVTVGLESTVLDTTSQPLAILRPGAITKRQIEEVTGQLVVYTKHDAEAGHAGPKAPGMKYRHYAPSAEVRIVFGGSDAFMSAYKVCRERDEKTRVGVFSWHETCNSLEQLLAPGEHMVAYAPAGHVGDAESLAKKLYGALRYLDETCRVDVILAQGVSDSDGNELGTAIMNRLQKAASNEQPP